MAVSAALDIVDLGHRRCMRSAIFSFSSNMILSRWVKSSMMTSRTSVGRNRCEKAIVTDVRVALPAIVKLCSGAICGGATRPAANLPRDVTII